MKYQVGTQLMALHSDTHCVIVETFQSTAWDAKMRFKLDIGKTLYTEEHLDRKFVIIEKVSGENK